MVNLLSPQSSLISSLLSPLQSLFSSVLSSLFSVSLSSVLSSLFSHQVCMKTPVHQVCIRCASVVHYLGERHVTSVHQTVCSRCASDVHQVCIKCVFYQIPVNPLKAFYSIFELHQLCISAWMSVLFLEMICVILWPSWHFHFLNLECVTEWSQKTSIVGHYNVGFIQVVPWA